MLEGIKGLLWGIPGISLLLGCGIWLSIQTGFVQIRWLLPSLREFWNQLRKEDSGGFRPLCTALAATVGTGNIAGVAGAIAIGGPGAVFWMWVSGLIGMATKYAEALLAVTYSQKRGGERIGGPMYVIECGLGKRWKWLALMYSGLGLCASFGVGNAAQVSAVVSAVKSTVKEYGFAFGHAQRLCLGVILAVIVWFMLSGGAAKIGETAELLVPFASCIYILLCTAVLVIHWRRIDDAIGMILVGAFSPKAVTGGAVGSMVIGLRCGVSRGVFTNEAGMGTAAIAHAGAKVDHPARQGMMGLVEVFLDTIVICSLTAFAILVSGISVPYGAYGDAELTSQALSYSLGPWASIMLSGCLICFALATVLGWGLYAGRCGEYLFGKLNWKYLAGIQAAIVFLGAAGNAPEVWTVSEILNGLMAIPNIIALVILSPRIKYLTQEFELDYLPGMCYDNAQGILPQETATGRKTS